MENFYVAGIYDTATNRMALKVLPRLSQDRDIKGVFLGFPAMGLTRVSPAQQVRPEVTQMPQGTFALGNRRRR